MSEKSLISVIVPVYNVEVYLSKCLSSIIHQTYKNLQILLVDDGSTDDSGKICDEFAQKDKRIEVVHKKNNGLVSARKAGLAIARGKYIGFVDGDDDIEEIMYERLLENLVQTGADFVHSGHRQNHMVMSQMSDRVIDISQDKHLFINRYVLSRNNGEFISHSVATKLFKAELIKESYAEVPDYISGGEDLINLIVCLLRAKKLSMVNASYYNYNNRLSSLVHNKDDAILLNLLRVFSTIETILIKYNTYDMIKDVLTREWLKTNMCCTLAKTTDDPFKIECYGIGNMQFLLGKKIVLYGAGSIGRDYYSQICRYKECKIVAWADINHKNIHYDCVEIVSPEILCTLDFDLILIAVKYKDSAEKIKNKLILDGIEKSKIMWVRPEQV